MSTTRPGRVLVLQHQDDAAVDLLGVRLRRAGLALDVVDVGRGHAVPSAPDHDAMVVLGGEMDVWQTDEHPWLAEEKALLRRWTAQDRGPLLGICLGHQLLADALGAEVGPMEAPEVGLTTVAATAAAAADPLLGPLGPVWPALQWHGVEVRPPPPGATVLATGAHSAVQAMRVGERWWGVQFHPEVGPEGAAAWAAHPVFAQLLAEAGGPDGPAEFRAAMASATPGLVRVTDALASAFARLVAGGVPAAGPKPDQAEATADGRASSTTRSRS